MTSTKRTHSEFDDIVKIEFFYFSDLTTDPNGKSERERESNRCVISKRVNYPVDKRPIKSAKGLKIDVDTSQSTRGWHLLKFYDKLLALKGLRVCS